MLEHFITIGDEIDEVALGHDARLDTGKGGDGEITLLEDDGATDTDKGREITIGGVCVSGINGDEDDGCRVTACMMGRVRDGDCDRRVRRAVRVSIGLFT
jgi:hypothetical protein